MVGPKHRLFVLSTFSLAVLASGCATRSPAGPAPTAPPLTPPSPARSVGEDPFGPDLVVRIDRVQPIVHATARRHAIDPELINAVIWVESRFDVRAKSPAGARGLMQLMPATAAAMARSMDRLRAAPYDPEFNISAGSLYLARLLQRYEGRVDLALAAYNAGAGNVDRWLDENGRLPDRSRGYVEKVYEAWSRFRAVHGDQGRPTPTMVASGPAPSSRPSEPVEPTTQREPERVVERRRPQHTERREPPPYVPSAPTRYDLDRVESSYEPTPPEEPPLRETPYRPRTTEEPKRDGQPQPASSSELPPPANAEVEGAPTLDTLREDPPSVLD